MCININKIEDLISKIALKNEIIGIDGLMFSEKSWLTAELYKKGARKFNIVNLDLYSQRGNGSFRDGFRYTKLGMDVRQLIKEEDNLIIEGILLLEKIEEVDIKLTKMIYIKNNDFESYERKIEEWKLSDLLEHYNDNLGKEIAEYHKNCKPYLKANYVFLNKYQ